MAAAQCMERLGGLGSLRRGGAGCELAGPVQACVWLAERTPRPHGSSEGEGPPKPHPSSTPPRIVARELVYPAGTGADDCCA